MTDSPTRDLSTHREPGDGARTPTATIDDREPHRLLLLLLLLRLPACARRRRCPGPTAATRSALTGRSRTPTPIRARPSTPRRRSNNTSKGLTGPAPFGDDLRLGQPHDPEGVDELLHPPCADPKQVAGRDHRGQRSLRAAAAFQQPIREVAALAQLGDRDIKGAGTGVQLPQPIAVAHVRALGRDLAVGSAATASASADIRVFMNVVSIERSRSCEADPNSGGRHCRAAEVVRQPQVG